METTDTPAKAVKTKSKTHYRVHVGGIYCRLCLDFDPRGVLIPDALIADAHPFSRLDQVEAAIGRTYAARSAIRDSMFRDWDKVKPLRFDGDLIREEFRVEVPVSA